MVRLVKISNPSRSHLDYLYSPGPWAGAARQTRQNYYSANAADVPFRIKGAGCRDEYSWFTISYAPHGTIVAGMIMVLKASLCSFFAFFPAHD